MSLFPCWGQSTALLGCRHSQAIEKWPTGLGQSRKENPLSERVCILPSSKVFLIPDSSILPASRMKEYRPNMSKRLYPLKTGGLSESGSCYSKHTDGQRDSFNGCVFTWIPCVLSSLIHFSGGFAQEKEQWNTPVASMISSAHYNRATGSHKGQY